MNIAANLTAVVERALPALSGSNVTYNKQHNIYLSDAYTSAMGNTYYQGIRLSNRIIISYSIGEGYLYTFLNGIRIYGYNGTDKKLIATKDLNCCIFSESSAKSMCIGMLEDYIESQAKLINTSLAKSDINAFSNKLVEEAIKNNPTRLLN